MLELILMAVLCGKLREMLHAKQRAAFGYQIALVALWLFVEPVFLGVLCATLFFSLGDSAEYLVLFAYAAAILCALASSLIVFFAAAVAQPCSPKLMDSRGS